MAILIQRSSMIATYVGPGDKATFAAWGGMRAYSRAAATALLPAADVVNASTGSPTTTIKLLANGSIDQASMQALGYSLAVTKLYDQTPGGSNHWTQATLSKMPTVLLTTLAGQPVMAFASASVQVLFGASITHAQPFSTSLVGKYISGSGQGTFWQSSGTGTQMGAGVSANQWYYQAGIQRGATASDDAWHTAQAVFKNPSNSDLYIDGASSGAADPSTGTLSSTLSIGATGSNTVALNGYIAEFGLSFAAFSAADEAALYTNQHNYWGV